MKYSRLGSYSLMLTGIFALALPFAHASSGGSSGGGGDVNCQEFYSIAVKESLALTKIGQATIDVVDPLIKADQVHDIVENLRVIPGKDLNRQAWSTKNPNNTPIYTTQLDVKAWKKLGPYDRYKLVSHELMVLAGIEFDGTYDVSGDLLRVVLASRYSLDLKSARYVINADGTYSITDPYFVTTPDLSHYQIEAPDATQDDAVADGVCIYLGFKRHVGTLDTVWQYLYLSSAKIDNLGRFSGLNYGGGNRFANLICSD